MAKVRVEDRIEYAENGINFVKVDPAECFGWGGLCICNGCNEQITNKPMNLCFLYGDLYCDDCFNEMTSHNGLSEEELEKDLDFQSKHALDWYKSYLGDD